MDYEEKCLKELNAVKFADRKLSMKNTSSQPTPKISIESSKKLQNFDLVLDKKLIMLVNEPNTSDWRLPKIEWTKPDNSLRQVSCYCWLCQINIYTKSIIISDYIYHCSKTAERVFENFKGFNVDFLGNAPFGVHVVKKDYIEKVSDIFNEKKKTTTTTICKYFLCFCSSVTFSKHNTNQEQKI